MIVPALEYLVAIIFTREDKIIPTSNRVHLIRNGRTEEGRGESKGLNGINGKGEGVGDGE